MSAEETELARRFVACKGWTWLPGMQAAYRFSGLEHCDFITCRLTYIRIGGNISTAACAAPQLFEIKLSICLPDLSDALTRAGVLPVVRQALDMPNLTPIIGADGWYLHGIPDDRPELWWSNGKASELHALLAALEAAPGV